MHGPGAIVHLGQHQHRDIGIQFRDRIVDNLVYVDWSAPESKGHPKILRSEDFAALTGSGIQELRTSILAHITAAAPTSETALLTNLRQQQAVSTALAALATALRATTNVIPHEMILLDLYESLRALDSLTGSTTSDDILHLIFSKFCIGK